MDYFCHEKAVVEPGARVGSGTRIWAFTNIKNGAVVGAGCNICDGSFVEAGAVLGNQVTLKNGVAVFAGVTLEDDVFCGAHVVFVNDLYPRSHRRTPWELKPVVVKKGATLGANAVILGGITIGPYALIAAGAVVTKDVPAYALVMGNPARVHGHVCICGKPLSDSLVCSCGVRFLRQGQDVRPYA